MKEEKARSNAKRNFTSSVNSFNLLHGDDALIDLLGRAFDKVERCWDLLENAQTAFIDATDIEDIETDRKGLPYKRIGSALSGVSEEVQPVNKRCNGGRKNSFDEYRGGESEGGRRTKGKTCSRGESVEGHERKGRLDRFLSKKVEMELAMANFARIDRDIKDLVAEASDGDKRREWKKREDKIDSLRKKLAAVGKIDPTRTVEIAQLKDAFVKEVETPFLAPHKWFIGEFKNSAIVLGGGDDQENF